MAPTTNKLRRDGDVFVADDRFWRMMYSKIIRIGFNVADPDMTDKLGKFIDRMIPNRCKFPKKGLPVIRCKRYLFVPHVGADEVQMGLLDKCWVMAQRFAGVSTHYYSDFYLKQACARLGALLPPGPAEIELAWQLYHSGQPPVQIKEETRRLCGRSILSVGPNSNTFFS
jgi:hypothetical protein